MAEERADIVVVGCGAAGLMAGIWAGREGRRRGRRLRVVALDGAKKIGVKILVAGGGRCNVTHHRVTAGDFAGGSSNAVNRVLRRFDVERTRGFFAELGVELKREETGKLFPVTDEAGTVLDALIGASEDAGVELRYPARVDRVERVGDGIVVSGPWGGLRAGRVILATGGKALPRSGSDGGGYAMAVALGHSVTERVFPALVPLVLEDGSVLRGLRGVSAEARLELRSGTGKRLAVFEGPALCTHFGLSGPAPMNMSRYWTDAVAADSGSHLVVCWVMAMDRERVDAALRGLGRRTVLGWLRERLPERLAEAICAEAGVDGGTAGAALTREARKRVLAAATEMRLAVVGDRGFTHAEVTAGGVPLDEVRVKTMGSRRCEGLYLCGEICDVDGRIGGFNFQWAWASGHIAGVSAATAAAEGMVGDAVTGGAARAV